MTNEDYKTDDEEIREIGFTARPVEVNGITLSPMTGLTFSWLMRNRVFQHGDSIQKTAAFAYLHSEDKKAIQKVVNNRAAFRNAVDDWMANNFLHHDDAKPYSDIMSESMDHYLAASTKAANPSGGKPAVKN